MVLQSPETIASLRVRVWQGKVGGNAKGHQSMLNRLVYEGSACMTSVPEYSARR